MSIDVWERPKSRRVGRNSAELVYLAQGSDDEDDIANAVALEAPQTHLGLVIHDVEIQEIGVQLWEATVIYGEPNSPRSKDPPEAGDEPEISFSTTGQTQHVTAGLQTMSSYENLDIPDVLVGSAPDYGTLINVNSEGEPEGIDIIVPGLKFSETHYFAPEEVTPEYIKTLARLTGKKNNAEFRGFSPGEVLFLGAQGQRRGLGPFAVTFEFTAEENITSQTYKGFTNVTKRGWDFFWVKLVEWKDDNAKRTRPLPTFAYVVEVYKDGDFSLLGID